MAVDPFIRDMERTMPVPPTSFPWMSPSDPNEWADEVYEMYAYMKEKERGSSIIFTGNGGHYGKDTGGHWALARKALGWVVKNSRPCEGHILRARVCDVLEARLPGQDEVHAEALGRLGEAMHVVFMKERVES